MEQEVDIDVEEGTTPAIAEDEMERIAALVLDEEGVTRPCLVSVSVVDDDRMHELNLEWRGKDRATDVLSLECERPDDPDLADGEPCELGDIVLAPAYIERQAEELGTTAADETRLLFVHGMLHLLGYDHIADDEAEVMEAREDELLQKVATDENLGHVILTRHREDA